MAERSSEGLLLRAEAVLDRWGEAWRARHGNLAEPVIEPHAGYRAGTEAHVLGRVLRPKPLVERTGTGKLSNMRAIGSLFATHEVPHAQARLAADGSKKAVTADEEGYIKASIEVGPPPERLTWEAVRGQLVDTNGLPSGEAIDMPVLATGTAARFAVVSDVDDTVMETGAENLARNLWTTFTGSPLTRRVYEHVPALYRGLQKHGGQDVNPIFYLSSSPWNLYGMIREVFERNGVPWGPIFLRDFGIDKNKFIKSTHGAHKVTRALELIDAHDGLPFIFIGDLGQADAEIYAQVARERPNAVIGVIIHQPSERAHEDKRQHLKFLEDAGVPLLVTTDYADALGFARKHGWIED